MHTQQSDSMNMLPLVTVTGIVLNFKIISLSYLFVIIFCTIPSYHIGVYDTSAEVQHWKIQHF